MSRYEPDQIEAPPKVKMAGENPLTIGVNCVRLLKTGQSVASVAPITYSPNDGSLTLSGQAPNAMQFDDDSVSQPVLQGQGVLFICSGGTAPSSGDVAAGPPYTLPLLIVHGVVYRKYMLLLTITLNNGDVRQARLPLLVPH